MISVIDLFSRNKEKEIIMVLRDEVHLEASVYQGTWNFTWCTNSFILDAVFYVVGFLFPLTKFPFRVEKLFLNRKLLRGEGTTNYL